MAQAQALDHRITEGAIWKQLLAFFFPILLGTFFQQLYNTADAMIVGQFVGKEALAAVGGATGVLINFLVNLFMGLSSGATVIIAQFYGAHNYEEVQRAVHTAIALAVAAGLGISVLGLLFSRPALLAMGTPEDVLGHALTYMRIYFMGTIASFIYNIGTGILRAVGDTRRPLYFLMAACLVNILLDLLFVAWLDWGVAGVGVATVLSQLLSAVLVVVALCRPGAVYQLFWRQVRFHGSILKEVLRIGLPAGIQSDMYCISNILIQSCINSFGSGVMASWTAFGKLDGFFWMICGAFGLSITTFVGQNFGAQKYDRVRRSVRVCMGMTFGASALVSLLLILCAPYLLRLFTSDPMVLETGIRIMWITTPFYFTYVCIEVLSGAIRGAGEAVMPMILVCGGVCVLRIVWIYAMLPLYPRFETVIVSYPITWAITSVLFIIYYLQGGWLRRCIAKAGFAPEVRPARGKKA